MRTIVSQGNPIASGSTASFNIGVGGNVSRLYGVEVIYDSGAPGTTVFTITNLGRTLIATPAGNGAAKYFPILDQAYGATGALLTTGNPYVEAVVSGTIAVAVSGAAPSTGSGYGVICFLYDD